MATDSAFAADFPEAEFRDAIHETMKMGMPQDPAECLRWHWNPGHVFEEPDPGGDPYDWREPVIESTAPDPTPDPDTGAGTTGGIIVDYALEITGADSGSDTTVLGPLDPTKVTVTLFETDWDVVKTADYCTIGGVRYNILFSAPPAGLFGVTMHTVYMQAQDEA